MSSTPTPYNRQANFVTDAQGNANITVSQVATELDSEFDAINVSLDQTQSRLAELQRDDGALKDQIVTSQALSTDILNKITTANNSYRGVWQTGTTYYAGDVAYKDLNLYYCAVTHTAGNFTTDLTSGDWTLAGSTASDTNDPNAYVPLTRWSLTPNGTATVFTITGTTVTNSAAYLVTVDGVLQDPASYTITTNTITFSEAPPSGTAVIVVGIGYAKGVQAGAIATSNLADGAVTTAKIADSSVTTAKLASGAVTPAKLSTGGPSWDTSGNVGIGTSSPTAKLDVSGSVNVLSAVVSNDGTTANRLLATGGVAYIGPTTNHPLSVQTNDTERLRITADGNVGIGTSSFAYASLGRTCFEVNGTESIVALKTGDIAKAYFYVTSSVANIQSEQIPITLSTAGNNYIQFTTNGVARVYISGTGVMDTQGNPIVNCPNTAKAWGGGSSAGVINALTYGVSTIIRTALGNYLVTMSTAINGYSVVATPDSSVSYQASAALVSTTQFRVYTFGASGAAQDAAFKFAVFGV